VQRSLRVEKVQTDGRIAREVEALLPPASSAGRASVTINAYCLEIAKAPPVAGTVFRIAGPSLQQRFARAERILDASRALRDAGRLVADIGELTDYVDAVRQWAIWTRQEGFDQRRFTEAFVDHAQKNVESNGTRWTRELEGAFRDLSAGRWRAVQSVLEEAARLETAPRRP
jgi:hypothetical protein